jgi:hypothetical protein
VAPRLTDYAMGAGGRMLQETSDPGRAERRDNLYAPREDGAERSSLPGGSRKTSLFLEAQLHPASLLPGVALAAAAGIGFAALRMLRPRSSSPRQSNVRQRSR